MSVGTDLLAGRDPQNTRVHCIGVGGVGVSAIAEMLVARGFIVSGSDMHENQQVIKLRQMGVNIFLEHAEKNINEVDIVVYSSAIQAGNPEYDAAIEQNIPLYKRAAMLASLTMHHQLVAIAGTHGKTTTTGMMVWVLHQAGMAPSFAVGGRLCNMNAYCQLTHGKYAVIEADESDASFLYYHPQLAILTNVDQDHLENYQGDYNLLKKTYVDFLQQVDVNGKLVVCADDDEAMQLCKEVKVPLITYGMTKEADYRIVDFQQHGAVSHFSVQRPQQPVLHCRLNCPGEHNALNATAVIAMSAYLGIADEYVVQALRSFSGMGRRFQRHGQIALGRGHAVLVEDYGHHPRELAVTLQAARQVWPNRRLLVLFQPHRFSRVQRLQSEFAAVLAQADQALVLDIFPAGEAPIEGVSSAYMAQEVSKLSLSPCVYLSCGAKPQQLSKLLAEHLQDQDICLLTGAGSIGQLACYLKDNYGIL